MIKIKQLIVHCSASGWGDAEEIDKWHKQRGWNQIGYHYVILNGLRKSRNKFSPQENGLVEAGRSIDQNEYLDVDERGAHAYGFNKGSIGVCLIGNKEFTVRQFQSLLKITNYWQSIIPDIEIMGHYQVSKHKTCPNFDIETIKELTGKDCNGPGFRLVTSYRDKIKWV